MPHQHTITDTLVITTASRVLFELYRSISSRNSPISLQALVAFSSGAHKKLIDLLRQLCENYDALRQAARAVYPGLRMNRAAASDALVMRGID